MKILRYAAILCMGVLAVLQTYAQDFSNKGKEFWLAYCYHVGMVNAGGPPQMTLYITSDVNTTYTVEIFGGSTIQSGSINAGQVITLTVPTTYFINDEGLFTNKTIRVTAVKPVVVYSYITRSAASGATLCLPTNVLGKEYYSVNFTQASNEPNSNSYFTIIGVENNTTVEITPSANTKNGWLANNTYTINLNKGEIYQVLGITTGNTGTDLSGSRIRSVAGGSGGCKRIAVFSGSGKIRIPASGCQSNSSDNLYQQLYPTGSWGKKYLTVPSFNHVNNYYRIIKNDPVTNVYVNGVLVPPSSFINNVYYQFFNGVPNLIEADKPISVAQYFTTQGCDGNSSAIPYDPDMIMLNPVEQNIDKVTLVSSNIFAAQPQHHIHVIMRNGGSGLSSFKLDGAPVGTSSWTVHPADPSYSYLYLSNVTQGYHTLSSDSGFNAIAYGYGQAESYGYSAGANVKDLYQFVSVQNQYGTVNFPAACKNSPFFFSMTFPYQPSQLQWVFNGLFADVTISSPVYDSTWFVNGKQLFRYKLPTPYTIAATGTYPVKVLALNPTTDGCTGEQEINYDLQVYDRPQADFNFTSNGCVSDSVHFFDNANTNGRIGISWMWNFGDNTTGSVKNPVHLYSAAGTYSVKYAMITDIGCLSDTVTKLVTLSSPPIAKFGSSIPGCVNKTVSFSDSSSATVGTLVKWTWNFGDGSPVIIATSNAPQTHAYANPGTYSVTLMVETSTGCKSSLFTKTITISPNPVPNFDFGNACLPSGNMQFTNTSSISDGSTAQLSYYWNFGDGGTSVSTHPIHQYSGTGPFSVLLAVTSNAGCTDTLIRQVNTIYQQPVSSFNAPASICFGSTVNFTDQSIAQGNTITQWLWNFGDGTGSTDQNPTHNFTAPGTYTVTLNTTSAAGCPSTTATQTVVVNALPVAGFTLSSPACAGQSILFTDASASASGNIIKWNWNMGDGTTQFFTSNAPFSHTYTATGTFTVTLIVETDKGCSSPVFSRQVVVHPLPLVGFTLPANCVADPFSQFNDTSTIADGSSGSFTYLWNFGDPNATAANPNTSILKNPTHKFSVVGPYNVSLTVTSNNGCSATRTEQVMINGTQPFSQFSINGNNPECSNKTIAITNQSTVDVGTIVRLEIYWDFANDPGIMTTVLYPSAGAVYTHDYPEFFTPSTRDVVIRVVAYSGISCLNSSEKTFTLKATPQVVFDPLAGVCADAPAFLITTASVVNGLPGSVEFTGTGVTASGSFNAAIAGTGTHTIRYTYTATNGCQNFMEQTIDVYPVPVVSAGPDLFVLEGGTAVLQGSGTGNNLSYLWTPATGLNEPSIAQPTTSPPDDITYRLEVLSSDGCSATDEVFVKLLKTPTIPNTFSPNGDGIHDRWEIKYLESYPGATIEIYNRYGQIVFKSTGYSKPWDGTMNGKQLPAGTYYYIINPKNGRRQMAGFVDIIR